MMSVSSSPGFDATLAYIVPAEGQTLLTSSPPGQSELRTSLICPVPAACNRIATFHCVRCLQFGSVVPAWAQANTGGTISTSIVSPEVFMVASSSAETMGRRGERDEPSALNGDYKR